MHQDNSEMRKTRAVDSQKMASGSGDRERPAPDYITRLELIKHRLELADARVERVDFQLRQLKDEQQAILQEIPDPLLIVRASDAVCTYVNPAFCRIFEYDATDLLNLSLYMGGFFVRDEDRDQITAHLGSRGRVDDFEFQCRLKSGAFRDALFTARSILFQGEPSFLVIIKDVTQPKKHQAELHRLETILNQAREIDALGQLAGSIGHEFNNLLMAISGNASLMLYNLDEQHPHYEKLKQILQSVQSGTELTAQLFDFSRQGKHRINLEEFNDQIVNRKQAGAINPSVPVDYRMPQRVMEPGDPVSGDAGRPYPEARALSFTQYAAFNAYEEIQKVPSTVLLVDDEHMLVDVGKEMLEKMGASVITALSGEDALRVYDQYGDKIDLVILDLVMPGMDGEAVFRALRDRNPNVRVLISSGFSSEAMVQRLRDAGCNGYIKKPFNVVSLSRTIKRILKP
ncbi:MAG: hypothetical protein CSA22_05955 [Deltaproteobacteria bacterium]|nr:MAG: hypothetical protein CSA22_05955 [Deltaproteobacteria bacterium]